LLLGLGRLSSGVKVRSLSISLELWSLLLELLLLLGLLELVEVGLSLASWLLLESVSLLLLLLLLLLLCSANLILSLSLCLLCQSLLFCSFTFSDKFSLDNLCKSLHIQAEEHVEGMLLPFLGQSGELSLAVLLQVWSKSQVLFVEGGLLLPVQSLPRCWVVEGLESKLLILKLLSNGKSLTRGQNQFVCARQVNVAKVSNEGFSLLSGETWGCWWLCCGWGRGSCCGWWRRRGAVAVTGATVVATGATVGGSVNPVIMSSATISSGFTVVTIEAIVVTTGAVVVSTILGASVVVASDSNGGAQETPAASSRVTKNIFMFIFISLLASQICSPALCQQSLRFCLRSGSKLTDQSQGRDIYL